MIGTLIRFGCLSILVHGLAFGALWAPRALDEVGGQADIVVVAKLTAVSQMDVVHADARSVSIQLQAIATLKGTLTSSTLTATFVSHPAWVAMSPESILTSFVGKAGIWFLKETTGRFEVLPITTAAYMDFDAVLPLSDSDASAPQSGTLDQQLLGYQLRWYRSLEAKGPPQDSQLFATLLHTNLQDSIPVVKDLLASPVLSEQILGLAVSIRLGSDDALSQLANEFTSLKTNGKFRYLNDAVQLFYLPKGPSSIAALGQLVAAHSAIPNLDLAVASALQRVGNKSVLPVIVQILDSQDDEAKRYAAHFMSTFATFSDKDGLVKPGYRGPLASDTVQRNIPRKDSGMTTDQYVRFWKNWWTDHRTQLGF